jgi:exosortase
MATANIPLQEVSKVSTPDASRWPLVLGLLAAVAVTYYPIIEKLLHVWFSDEDMAHGIFVPLVAGYAVWQSRGELKQLKPGIFPVGLVVCGLAGLVRIGSVLTGEAMIGRLALVATIAGIVHLFYGWKALRALAFVFFLLLFGIPIPKLLYAKLTVVLQMIASVLSERVLEMLDYTVIRQGNILEMAGQKLSVAEACSGIRSLFSLSFLVSAYLYLHENRSRAAQAFVVLATIPVAVGMNALRIVITAVVGEKDPEFALGLFHASAGWVLSFAGFGLLMALHTVFLRLTRRKIAV